MRFALFDNYSRSVQKLVEKSLGCQYRSKSREPPTGIVRARLGNNPASGQTREASMKRKTILGGFAVLVLLMGGTASADDTVTLEGSFVWEREDGQSTGDLTAVLTPHQDSGWDVAFHFVWEDEDHTYLGQATGNLDAGPFEGTAENDNPDNKISFRFSGEFEDGTFTGTHGWIKDDGSLERGGRLTLGRAPTTNTD